MKYYSREITNSHKYQKTYFILLPDSFSSEMKYLLSIPKFIFTAWGGIFFTITMIFVFPVYFIVFGTFGSSAPRIAHRIAQIWAKVVFTGFFIRLRISGKELIDEKKTYVFAANHQSLLDIPAYVRCADNTSHFLAKEELTKIPILGYVIKKFYITVKREDKADRKKSLETMMNSILRGISVFLCPEGTRNKTDGLLLDFRDGAFVLAIEAQIPIAVLTVMNSKKLLPPTGFFSLSPGTIHAKWDPPIETKGMKEEDIPALKERVRNMMLKNIEEFNLTKSF